jgi:Ser/Thr protein kinase RdoA (MazF antagonist)
MPDFRLIDTIAATLGVDRDRIAVLASREGRVIGKVTLPTGDVVAKASTTAGAFDGEAAAMRTLATLGIPVSEVLAIESGPPALLVATWANGVPITARTNPDILRSVGRILRRIHQVPAGPPFSANPTVAWWIQGWYNVVIEWWDTRESIGPDLRHAADAWMDAVRPVLEAQPGCLFLLDGRPEHFLVDGNGAIRLIDVADLQPGEAAMDLAVLELDAPGILTHVLDGYAPSPAEQAAFDRLIPFYIFLRALSAAEWRSRMQGDEASAHRYLDIARTALEQHATS